ncbi:hypothetical protein GGR54DRAFT_624022 [Hypoxylon sp. NC1633]|nr:hypothetical protein GGR54DRAFT_624022 [Hypoxylon sp. NC1633]
MTKLIPSISHQLCQAKDENENLEKVIRNLEAEVLLLETQISKHNLPIPRSKAPQPTTERPENERNYLKATVASRNRTATRFHQDGSADVQYGGP